jgi:two-component system, OmpR family, phosphate regulon sensor histidine kinase PhoR
MVSNVPTKATIMIVDDIPDTVQLLGDWLESQQFNVLGVTNSLEVLDTAQSQKPDLILLDIMMPKMDGMEICRRLKANPHTAQIPVIIVTARNPSDARAEGMMAGAVDYITKPVNLQDLKRRVESALSLSSQQPADVQRLLEEVAHSTLTIMSSALVWLLGVDEGVLRHRNLVTTSGAKVETEFLLAAGNNQPVPEFAMSDFSHPFVAVMQTRKLVSNLRVEALRDSGTAPSIYRATELLRLNYLTLLPLVAAGKNPGLMILGSLQPIDMETPRTSQILTSLGTQAAIALDYARLITDLTSSENNMRREQSFRQMILDTMSDGLVVIDNKGEIKYVNRRLLRMTDYPKGYLEGRSVGELFHTDDRMEVTVGLLREGVATMKFEQRLITRHSKVIPVWLTRSRAQSEDLSNQVVVLSDMTEQKRREEDLERQTSRLFALNEAAHAITANLSLTETLKNILNAAHRVVESQGTSLFLVDPDQPDMLEVVEAVGVGADKLQGLRIPIGEGVAGWVAREAKSQLVGDVERESRFFTGVDEQTGLNTRSLIAVPLIHAEKVIGVIEVVNKLNDGLFEQGDVRLLESIAGTAAVSIMNARLFDETQRRVHELSLLLNASGAASSTLQFAQVLENIAHNVADGLEVGRCTIMSWNAEKACLESLAEVAEMVWPVASAPRRPLTSLLLSQTVLTTRKPVIASLDTEFIPQDQRALLLSRGMTSLIALPLLLQANLHGVVYLFGVDSANPLDQMVSDAAAKVIETWGAEFTSLTELPPARFTSLMQKLRAIPSVSWVGLRHYHENDDHLALIGESGFAEWTTREGSALPIANYAAIQRVIRDQEIQSAVLTDQQITQPEHEWVTNLSGRSYMLVPLIERGNTVGILKLIDAAPRIFADNDIRLAQGIANVVGSAMENARLYRSLEQRAQALESAFNELREADQAKDELIQNVSHELRTPLISVLGYAGLLADGGFGDLEATQRDALNQIVEKAQHLSNLVGDIVSVQSLANPHFVRQQFEFPQLLADVLAKYQKRADEVGVKITSTLHEKLPTLYGDPEKITEAIEKLIDNAIKFGAEGKSIEINVEDTRSPVIQISIRDYGIGIDPAEHQKIFRRFYQVDGGTARRFGGAGLGLAIVKSIVEGHGGRIHVESRLNEGTTFSFTLPKYTENAS